MSLAGFLLPRFSCLLTIDSHQWKTLIRPKLERFFRLRGWFAIGKPSRFATAPTPFGSPWSWSRRPSDTPSADMQCTLSGKRQTRLIAGGNQSRTCDLRIDASNSYQWKLIRPKRREIFSSCAVGLPMANQVASRPRRLRSARLGAGARRPFGIRLRREMQRYVERKATSEV